MRYKNHDDGVQRWLCRDCGYRFSQANLNHSNQTPRASRIDRQSLNRTSALLSKRQVCELLTEESKNLTEVARQETASREGTLQTTESNGKIIEYILHLKKAGYSEATILGRSKILKILTKRGAILYDPDSVKAIIAKQCCCEGRRANAVDACTSFLKMTGGKWEPPRYQGVRKIPFIPTETEVDQLIAACSKRMATFLQLLKETGIRCGEAWQLKCTDIDTATKTVRITPEKNSNPRISHISPKLAAMFESLPQAYGQYVFAKAGQSLEHHRGHFILQRRRVANKLKNPRLLRITFHTLRHLKGTMEYHRTKDILHVMQTLGHKNIKNTLMYVQLAEELFKDEQEYVSKVAKTETYVCALIDAGFEYICDYEGHKIFRKRKY